MRILQDKPIVRNPLNGIIRSLIMRARYNSHRCYEIYAVDCDTSLDETYWKDRWNTDFLGTAELIRTNGHVLYSDRQIIPNKPVNENIKAQHLAL